MRDAIAATRPGARHAPPLVAPATPEAILTAIDLFNAPDDDGTNRATSSDNTPAAEPSPPPASVPGTA
jgi:xanthine dehydrogenase large subunit